MTNNEALKILYAIKDKCKKHATCDNCPFDGDPAAQCPFRDVAYCEFPAEWDLPDLDGSDRPPVPDGGSDEDDEPEYVRCEPEEKPVKSHTTPSHYDLDPEPVEVIKKWGLDFCRDNVVKYVARAGRKDGNSADADLHKAIEYLRIALEDIE